MRGEHDWQCFRISTAILPTVIGYQIRSPKCLIPQRDCQLTQVCGGAGARHAANMLAEATRVRLGGALAEAETARGLPRSRLSADLLAPLGLDRNDGADFLL